MFVLSGEDACCEVASELSKLDGLGTAGMRFCPDSIF
jgi:hypothetical protein